MLLGRNWIACRAAADGLIDRISIDIDAPQFFIPKFPHLIFYWSLTF